VVGWFEPKADKQKEELKKRMFPEMYAKSWASLYDSKCIIGLVK
jgi:hypothetical protein